MLGQVALVTSALFTGAAIYVAAVEHPVRMAMPVREALAEFKPSYTRGAFMQAGLALATGLLGVAAWFRYQSNWFWLAGGIVMLAAIAYTFAAIWSTNGKLKATPIEQANDETRALLNKWGLLHIGRTGFGVVATALLFAGFF